MTIKQKVDSDVLGAFCTFWTISLLLTFLMFCAQSAVGFPFIKIVSAIPYGLHAGIALEAFDHFRKGGGVDDQELWKFSMSQGLHGIAVSPPVAPAINLDTDKMSVGSFHVCVVAVFAVHVHVQRPPDLA